MTIAKGSKITFSDLIDFALNKVMSICTNIDKSVSDYFINGNVDVFYNNGKVNITNTLNYTISTVSSATVKQELIDFMSARGCYSVSNEIVSAKTLLNFSGNFSSFVAIHVRNGIRRGQLVIFYVSSSDTTSFPVSIGHGIKGQTDLDKNQLTLCLADLITSIKSGPKIQNLTSSFAFNCSSSSSSSSSSCSTSSSSSSCCTSIFIAYMKI